MALRTLGTSTTTVLQGLVFSGMLNPQDFGNLKNLLKPNSATTVPQIDSQALEQSGILRVQGNRGLLTALPGDVIAVDPVSGFPIVVSARALTGGSWVLT